MFTKKNNIKLKPKIDKKKKINLYFHCIDCGFKRFDSINKEELRVLLKDLI